MGALVPAVTFLRLSWVLSWNLCVFAIFVVLEVLRLGRTRSGEYHMIRKLCFFAALLTCFCKAFFVVLFIDFLVGV